ncbi:MAG TPA: SDR family oxidoreductase [Acidobacteriaceae bacterium]|nr:SDR family oxidoreductase [Acidobacteriaceae bacterium]
MADRLPAASKRVLALGATSAIAQATLRLLAEQQASFFIVGRNEQKLAAVRDDLLTRGASAVSTFAADLDDTDAHPAMLSHAVTAMGGIDVALLAHGVLGDQPEAEKNYAVAAAILQTNFLSAVSLVTWLANYFEAEHRGTIAVVSSVAGDRGRKSNYVYGASKGGLNIFLDGVRNRIDRAGVQVLTIKPGFVATPMTAHLKKNALFAEPAQVAKYILRAIEKRKDVVYAPPFWGLIMLLVRSIPRRIFKKMNL